MNLARVCGNVVATCKYDTLNNYKLLIIQPIDENMQNVGKSIIATDLIGAGTDEIVFYVTSKEASNPMEYKFVPTDASVIGIVDRIDLEECG